MINCLNLKPNFCTPKLPCEGKVGDLLILSPLEKDELDPAPAGQASLWVCVKAALDREELPAVWARVAFGGLATCRFPVQPTPQDLPNLAGG